MYSVMFHFTMKQFYYTHVDDKLTDNQKTNNINK